MELQHEQLDDFEPLILKLYNTAFASERIAKSIVFPSKLAYIEQCHRDYDQAQKLIVAEVCKLYDLGKEKEEDLKMYRNGNADKKNAIKKLCSVIDYRILVLRRLADSIALKLFDGQIWLAKRFDIDKRVKMLDIAAVKSNLEAASLLNKDDSKSFALVSDLTTYIGVGDLMWKHYSKGKYKWLMVELKLGKVNKMLGEIVESGGITDSAVAGFDPTTKKQLNRMIRQKDRRDKIEELVKHNKGIDVKTGTPLTLGESDFRWTFWNTILEGAIKGAKEKQVCLCTVEDCFMIFASTLSDLETFHFLYDIIYGMSNCAICTHGTEEEVRAQINQMQKLLRHPYVKDITASNMSRKWRTPFFLLAIEPFIGDLLFHRMRVLLYLDIEKFVAFCASKGYKVESLTKRETNFFRKHAPETPLYKGRAMKITTPDGKCVNTGDGLFNRMFFDLVAPSTLLEIIARAI